MGNHFACIGVEIEPPDDLAELISRIYNESEAVERNDGGWFHLARDVSGALIGINLNGDGEVECLTPSFAATSTVRSVPGTFLEDAECRFCDRLYIDVLDEDGELVYPMAVQLHDMALARDRIRLRTPTDASLAAFAEEISVWPGRAAYEAEQRGPPALDAESLIPSGLFVDSDEIVPEAHVLLTGRIVKAEVKESGWGGGAFRWAVVRTYGGDYEILAPIAGPELTPDTIVQGTFWVVGALRPSRAP
jgi:hypothetical protein